MESNGSKLFLTRAEARAIDRRAADEYGIAGAVLMENAGRGAAELLTRLGVRGAVAVCCGKGNNGGDGLVMARHLALRGVPVRVLLFCRPEDLSGDAGLNYRPVARLGLPVAVQPDPAALASCLGSVEWAVDALYGTGLNGPVRPPMDALIEAINRSPARVLAVDIPSGLDCDTGLPLGPTVRAHHTVTFAALKAGFANPAARAWTGVVHVADIGAPITSG